MAFEIRSTTYWKYNTVAEEGFLGNIVLMYYYL